MGRKILVTLGLVLLWALAVVALVFAEARWFAHPSFAPGDLAALEDHLVRELRDAADDRRLGGAALVLIQSGAIVAEHGFGVAHAETQAPVNPEETLFLVASVSKAVTAWGVLDLVEEGQLGLDEPVMRQLRRWRFPGSEAHRDKVTARHLLSHTAGLDDGLGYGGFPPGETIQTLEESLSLPRDSTVGEPRPVRVAWEPGIGMAYSGAGYAVLQLLIEEVTGRPFADHMKEAVLEPLGMTRSSFDLDAIAAEGRAQDVVPAFDPELRTSPPRRYAAPAAVALYTTPRDLARFALAHIGDNPVLGPETRKQMMTPQRGTAGTWGLGLELFVENDAGGHVVGHVGGTYPAWGASFRVNPATGNGMILMSSGGRGATNQLGHDWIYWETGTVTPDARLQVVQNRLLPAAWAIALGAIALALWKMSR